MSDDKLKAIDAAWDTNIEDALASLKACRTSYVKVFGMNEQPIASDEALSADFINAIDHALLKAWHLGISNGIDSETDSRAAWKRADATAKKFDELRLEIRTKLQASMLRKAGSE